MSAIPNTEAPIASKNRGLRILKGIFVLRATCSLSLNFGPFFTHDQTKKWCRYTSLQQFSLLEWVVLPLWLFCERFRPYLSNKSTLRLCSSALRFPSLLFLTSVQRILISDFSLLVSSNIFSLCHFFVRLFLFVRHWPLSFLGNLLLVFFPFEINFSSRNYLKGTLIRWEQVCFHKVFFWLRQSLSHYCFLSKIMLFVLNLHLVFPRKDHVRLYNLLFKITLFYSFWRNNCTQYNVFPKLYCHICRPPDFRILGLLSIIGWWTFSREQTLEVYLLWWI